MLIFAIHHKTPVNTLQYHQSRSLLNFHVSVGCQIKEPATVPNCISKSLLKTNFLSLIVLADNVTPPIGIAYTDAIFDGVW